MKKLEKFYLLIDKYVNEEEIKIMKSIIGENYFNIIVLDIGKTNRDDLPLNDRKLIFLSLDSKYNIDYRYFGRFNHKSKDNNFSKDFIYYASNVFDNIKFIKNSKKATAFPIICTGKSIEFLFSRYNIDMYFIPTDLKGKEVNIRYGTINNHSEAEVIIDADILPFMKEEESKEVRTIAWTSKNISRDYENRLGESQIKTLSPDFIESIMGYLPENDIIYIQFILSSNMNKNLMNFIKELVRINYINE